MMERIEALWRGHVPLDIAFWHFAMLYGLLLNAATSMLFMFLITSDAGIPILTAAFLLPIPYNILIVVAVWRSAGRYAGPRQWVDWARFGTVLWMIALTAS
ncbi:MAG: hypothetical protein GKS00_20750 [Alphaproteobacteria bacterium]|nr:hypothetical protein [Alphaproteobacteria bacterium]